MGECIWFAVWFVSSTSNPTHITIISIQNGVGIGIQIYAW
jgi:hypothetical protein